jgi:hypothetical protein
MKQEIWRRRQVRDATLSPTIDVHCSWHNGKEEMRNEPHKKMNKSNFDGFCVSAHSAQMESLRLRFLSGIIFPTVLVAGGVRTYSALATGDHTEPGLPNTPVN